MPRSGLDTTRVVAQAARIADEEGLAALTLASVAESLGVRAPSLYNHVDGLPGLLRLLTLLSVGEQLTDAMRNAAVGRSGADALRSVAYAYRAYAQEHPGRYAATIRAPAPEDTESSAPARGRSRYSLPCWARGTSAAIKSSIASAWCARRSTVSSQSRQRAGLVCR